MPAAAIAGRFMTHVMPMQWPIILSVQLAAGRHPWDTNPELHLARTFISHISCYGGSVQILQGEAAVLLTLHAVSGMKGRLREV